MPYCNSQLLVITSGHLSFIITQYYENENMKNIVCKLETEVEDDQPPVYKCVCEDTGSAMGFLTIANGSHKRCGYKHITKQTRFFAIPDDWNCKVIL